MPTPSSTKTTFINETSTLNNTFSAIRLTVASPEDIQAWSHGEVVKPETINYRTQKPEKDGLFCERIFGPSKDWECYCGKYKRIRYKGIVCDKCGVEVTRALVRRERFGHIDLATPVSHIWFLRGVPSKIGLLLNLSVQDLEKVIYFASFIITYVNEEARADTLEQIKNELKTKRKAIERDAEQGAQILNQERAKRLAESKSDKDKEKIGAELIEREQMLIAAKTEKLDQLDKAAETAKKELKDLKVLEIISESTYRDLSLKYGHVFEAQIGAEAIRKLLTQIELHKLNRALAEELKTAIPSKKKKLIRRSKLVKNLLINKIRPEWMILTNLPVIPPDLRPMVALDGGRFATSDLNDLYRRIINRNNRLKRLIELKAPEVIQRNEKRMLQEAVDALFDNSARRSKTVTASTGQRRQLKSIADMLKGKQGRFRQNLLGKRVDYSGRSVIVIGPTLQLHQCGLPKTMALELFRPFVISHLIKQEIVHNVRSANRYIEQDHPEVWDILEEITKNYHVLLNRAPTLHRLGIQAFQPILIEGKAIKIHPMVCSAFNADFDGDQMAVHVPLTEGAKKEAAEIMLSTRNLLKPSSGEPIVEANQDIVWGCYYITDKEPGPIAKNFSSATVALYAHQIGKIKLQTPIMVQLGSELLETTAGRIIFNALMPEDFGYINQTLAKKDLRKLIASVFQRYGRERTVQFLDDLKNLGFRTITDSGMSFGIDDIPTLAEKGSIIHKGDALVTEIQKQYEDGLLTKHERYIQVIENWTTIKNEISELSQNKFTRSSSLFSIVNSGARGTWQQMIQVMGMKGLVNNPSGEIIELPIKASFREGLDVLEYFIASHGTRKGLADTALRTASAGYLTRRLVDIAQDIIITEDDCGDTDGLIMTKEEMVIANETVTSLITGRTLLEPIIDPATKKVVIPANKILTEEDVKKLGKVEVDHIHMRSLLSCRTIRGVCQKCYGFDLAYNQPVAHGTSVGIMAAQSIGEPGTQLTMRTFHTGGVAGADITQGLPRVEELFEVRPPKNRAITSEVAGQIIIDNTNSGGVRNQRLVKVRYQGRIEEEHIVNEDYDVMIEDGAKVTKGTVLLTHTENEKKKVLAEAEGIAKVQDDKIQIITDGVAEKEFIIPPGYALYVKNGDLIKAGDALTEGALDLQELFVTQGILACQKYLIREVQRIYATQAGKLNSKHLELIVRQLFSRLYIKDSGDTPLLPGEIVTRAQFLEENEIAAKTGKAGADGKVILLGITKASLTTDSFLSAASFQETARVLIDAAVSGRIDKLRGLKENVIIGRLIPAGTGFGIKKPEAAAIEEE